MNCNYYDSVTREKTAHFAELWANEKEEIITHCTVLLVRRLEKGFASKEEEKGFREGLYALPQLWSGCGEQVIRNIKIAQAEKKKEERKKRFANTF